MRSMRFALVALAIFAFSPGARAAEDPNHEGAAIGGAVAGLVCGGATLVYAKARERAGGSGPLLWHTSDGPGWIGVFFLEHAGVGGLSGAFGDRPRTGFLIGGAVTCGLDVLWIVSAEILAKAARDDDEGLSLGVLGLAEKGPDGWRMGIPPVIVTRRGAWVSLLAWRF